jgi:hypothetical protein
MHLSKLLDWRKVLVYTHRWLGIAGLLFFILWFVSGIVMMYADMPGVSVGERLARMPCLDLSRVTVDPHAAAAQFEPEPTRLRVAMLGDRPVYRLLSGSRWVGVYADTGAAIPPLSPADAVGALGRLVPDRRGSLRHDARLVDSDQWSLYSGIRAQMPLHRIAVGDEAGTYYYVTERTGDLILKTTREGRLWAYAGPVLHWLYVPALRRQSDLWSSLVVWIALAGCAMCASGLVWGVWRYSLGRRYRLRGGAAMSPYAGLMRWHHYLGLGAGVTTLTWAFSGAVSLNPFEALRSRPLTPAQRDAAAGGPIDFRLLTVDGLRRATTRLQREAPVTEVEFVQYQGRPFVLGYVPPPLQTVRDRMDGDVQGVLSAVVDHEHLIASTDPDHDEVFRRFNDESLARVARAAMPGARVADEVWLHEYDAYYYGRKVSRPLPVLRVRFDDPDVTWLYLDPQHGRISVRLEQRDRWRRWLYHGLHSLDLPALYRRRPLWDLTVIALSLGGLALSLTTVVPAIRRVRRHLGKRQSAWSKQPVVSREWLSVGTRAERVPAPRNNPDSTSAP